MEKEIISKARLEDHDGVRILKIRGSPYEMGYQHGWLLSSAIKLMVTQTTMSLPAYVSTLTGQSFEKSLALARDNASAAKSHLPNECLEEIRGIVDGASAASSTQFTFDQILLWNTYYDQWCIYCHPHYWRELVTNNKPKHGSLAGSVGCSSFSAWDKEWAGGDGRLVFGKNEDNFNMPFQLENRIMVVAKPDQGNGHVFITFPGLIGFDGGFNEKGLQIMTQLNSMKDETMEGYGIGVLTRLMLRRCTSVKNCIELLGQVPLCGGIAWHVADGVAKQAVIVETSSKRICVRYPHGTAKAIWQSNHSNCYPGWEGYAGYNMVKDQQLVNVLDAVDTVENWQRSLRDPENMYVQAPSRFERYRQLLQEYKGNITISNAIKILCDRYDPYTQQTRNIGEVSPTNNIRCTICALYPDMSFGTTGRQFKAHIANLWSMVSTPETGDFWLAIKDFPAQYGGYQHFNLHCLLQDF